MATRASRPVLKGAASLLMFPVPFVTILVLRQMITAPPQQTFPEKAEPWKDAMTLLLSSSQTMVTVTLSIVAAQGYFLLKERDVSPLIIGFFASLGLLFASISIYFSAQVGFWASSTIFTGNFFIKFLDHLLNLQAGATLLSASCLGSLACRVALK